MNGYYSHRETHLKGPSANGDDRYGVTPGLQHTSPGNVVPQITPVMKVVESIIIS